MSEYSSSEGCTSNGSRIWLTTTTSTGKDITITLPEVTENTPQQYTIFNEGEQRIAIEPGPYWRFAIDEAGDLTDLQVNNIIAVLDKFDKNQQYLAKQREANKMKAKGEQCELLF